MSMPYPMPRKPSQKWVHCIHGDASIERWTRIGCGSLLPPLVCTVQDKPHWDTIVSMLGSASSTGEKSQSTRVLQECSSWRGQLKEKWPSTTNIDWSCEVVGRVLHMCCMQSRFESCVVSCSLCPPYFHSHMVGCQVQNDHFMLT